MKNIGLGVKVFSATKYNQRQMLGDTITNWIRNLSGKELIGSVVTQSSDREFHCLTITIFYKNAQ